SEGGPEVVALEIEARRPDVLARADELGLCLLRQPREITGMARPQFVLFAGLCESLERVLANDLEHREAPLVRAGVGDEALVRKRAEDRQHVLAVAGTDRLGGVERPAAGKGGEAGRGGAPPPGRERRAGEC